MHRPARKTAAAIITVVGVAASAAYAYAVAPNDEMVVGKQRHSSGRAAVSPRDGVADPRQLSGLQAQHPTP